MEPITTPEITYDKIGISQVTVSWKQNADGSLTDVPVYAFVQAHPYSSEHERFDSRAMVCGIQDFGKVIEIMAFKYNVPVFAQLFAVMVACADYIHENELPDDVKPFVSITQNWGTQKPPAKAVTGE